MLPFTKETIQVSILLVVTIFAFYFLELSFHPVLNIIIKSLGITTLYIGVLYKFKISEDVFKVLTKVLGKKEQ